MLDFDNDPHRRYNPLTGEWVKVSPHRSKRPWQGKVEVPDQARAPAYDPSCYLCPGNERVGGVKNPGYEGPWVFDNDFSALLPDSGADSWQDGELLVARGNRGICRVMCFSPRHDLTLAKMDLAGVEAVVRTWRAEYESLGAIPWIRHVQIFENRGEAMGCSNPHPHCQIWAEDTIPDIPAREFAQQRAWFERKDSLLLLDYARLEIEREARIVVVNDDFVALVPFWAVWPFETLVLPLFPAASLSDFSPLRQKNLAALLRDLTARYDRLFECPFPYSMGLHQAPVGDASAPGAQFHMHFYPPLLRSATVRKFMVGYEMLAMSQRDISPEQAAARLRALPNGVGR